MPDITKDKFGPEYIVDIYDSKIDMKGFLVIDNTVLGRGKGGIRMTPTVTKEEVSRLARTMTWKNALFELPFGGAKAGIVWPGGSPELKKQFVQSFARMIKPFTPKLYIAGPDVSVGEREMQWFVEATGNWRSATGKPANLCLKVLGKKGERCGLPHEFGSTGFGVAEATRVAVELKGMDITKASVAIEGFGNVGSFVFKFLKKMGARIIAVVDSRGGVYNKNGLDDKELLQLKKLGKSVSESKQGRKISHDDVFGVKADILIPASVTDVINNKNKNKIKARIIVESANIPMSEKIEKELFRRGILVVPDFLANGGGVISSYAEYRGYNPKQMFKTIRAKITKTTKRVIKESLKYGINPREVALRIAKTRIEKLMR